MLRQGIVLLVICIFMLGCRAEASLPKDLQRQEVIFLIDSSQSMMESDPLRLIPETVLEMCAALFPGEIGGMGSLAGRCDFV